MITLLPEIAKSYILPPMVAVLLLISSSTPTSPQIQYQQQEYSIPVLEVIKVFGKMAGKTCYGKIAPEGSSCQISSTELKQSLGLLDDTISLDKDTFQQKLNNELMFQWPLKPYGIDKSLEKTATMNKGAETRLYMDQLQSAGLYDPRNPTGPLPTSLRPNLNKIIQKDSIQQHTIDKLFFLLRDPSLNQITSTSIDENLFQISNVIDYYEFIKFIGGSEKIQW